MVDMNEADKAIIKRVLEKKNPLYDFEVHDKEIQKKGFLTIEECGDIEFIPGWHFITPSEINRNGGNKNVYYVLCKEKTGLTKIRAEMSKNINLTIIWLTIFISVCTSTISNVIVKVVLHKLFGLNF